MWKMAQRSDLGLAPWGCGAPPPAPSLPAPQALSPHWQEISISLPLLSLCSPTSGCSVICCGLPGAVPGSCLHLLPAPTHVDL